VDLAYLTEQDIAEKALEQFENRLYRLISFTLATDEISLVNMRRAPAFLRWRVLVEEVLLFCRDERGVASMVEEIYRHAPDIQWLRASGNRQFLEAFEMSGQTVDKERITEFLRLISQDLLVLREKARVPMETYLNSRDLQSIVERRLQTAIESATNIGNHIIARWGLRPPQDCPDVFRILQEAKVLPEEVASPMMDMARFRNLLVRGYWRIDYKSVYESLLKRIEALQDFAKHIGRWLKSNHSITNLEK
jgi:uncharacterized protein YutE (UPF0331/DUF86 family)